MKDFLRLELPVLPLRNTVVLPHTTTGVDVGRLKSKRAVEEALSRLEQGSVLLAPLAASFDQFRDYKDRAQAFREAVFALGGEPWTPSSS